MTSVPGSRAVRAMGRPFAVATLVFLLRGKISKLSPSTVLTFRTCRFVSSDATMPENAWCVGIVGGGNLEALRAKGTTLSRGFCARRGGAESPAPTKVRAAATTAAPTSVNRREETRADFHRA